MRAEENPGATGTLKILRYEAPLCLREESAWAEFTKSFIELKRKYCTDRSLPVSDEWKLDMVFKITGNLIL